VKACSLYQRLQIGGPAGEFPTIFFPPQKIPEKIQPKKAAGHGLMGTTIFSTAFISLPFPPPNLANNFIPSTRELVISGNAMAYKIWWGMP
jgi:hypothetical protein